jgi:hypothetical protein
LSIGFSQRQPIWQDFWVSRTRFKTGLQKLTHFDAEVLAGHGTVLYGDIPEFLKAIGQAI